MQKKVNSSITVPSKESDKNLSKSHNPPIQSLDAWLRQYIQNTSYLIPLIAFKLRSMTICCTLM